MALSNTSAVFATTNASSSCRSRSRSPTGADHRSMNDVLGIPVLAHPRIRCNARLGSFLGLAESFPAAPCALEVLFDGDQASSFVEAATLEVVKEEAVKGIDLARPDLHTVTVSPHSQWIGQQGLYCLRDVAASQAIFQEGPVVISPLGPSSVIDGIHAFLKLPQDVQIGVLSLRAKSGPRVMSKEQFERGLSLQGAEVPKERVEDAWTFARILNENQFQTGSGNALYQILSRANHSCDPNSFRAEDSDGAYTLFALRSIAAGEEITVNYVTDALLLMPVVERQKIFQRLRGWSCVCTRCRKAVDDMRVFPCVLRDCLGEQYVIRAKSHEIDTESESEADSTCSSTSSDASECDELSSCTSCGLSGQLLESKRLAEAQLVVRYFALEETFARLDNADSLLALLDDLKNDLSSRHWLFARLHNLLAEHFSKDSSVNLRAAIQYRCKELSFWDCHMKRASLKRAWLRENLGDLLYRSNRIYEAIDAFRQSFCEMRCLQPAGSTHCKCVLEKLQHCIRSLSSSLGQ